MIAKCVALLAIVAQINGYVCNSNCAGSIIATGAAGLATGAAGLATGAAGLATGIAGNTRNIVARGRYPVAMDNIGPLPDPRIPVTTSHAQAPLQEKPIVRLPTVIPTPKTVAHSCTCQKTILRPRVHDQLISVPSVQRYIETTHTPVVENIHYEAVPINSGIVSTGAQLVPATSGFGVSSFGAYPTGCSAGVTGVASAVPIASVASGVPVSSVAAAVPVGSYSGYSTGVQGCYC